MGQYSEHRRPTAVPKVQRVEHYDATGEVDLKVQKSYEDAMQKAGPTQKPKRSFAELVKKPKK
ncbi:MAG: hypothetical protein JNK82_00575 [Myxococcaceae bacterium]|nr:hypothetical protein [Myxococcaceae bacterium]